MSLLILQMFPAAMALPAIIGIIYAWGLSNNIWVLIIILGGGSAYNIWLLKGAVDGISDELVEAAYIDGCGRMKAFLKVLVPVAKPGVIVCAIFSFLYSWGDLAYGMTFILDQQKRPIT